MNQPEHRKNSTDTETVCIDGNNINNSKSVDEPTVYETSMHFTKIIIRKFKQIPQKPKTPKTKFNIVAN